MTRHPPPSRPNERLIADYGLIGDMRGAAPVEWLCLPRFDNAPAFLALLDQGRGGAARSSRRYLPGTSILETTLATRSGANGWRAAGTPSGGTLDAALPLMPLMEAVDANDRRMAATLEAVERDLRVAGDVSPP